MNSGIIPVDPAWTLFLDRDGVINRRIEEGYVTNWREFSFLPGVLEAMHLFTTRFGRIIVVTNQQGIGKKLMTGEELQTIHSRMQEAVEEAGGRIDAVYYSPFLQQERSFMRKPAVGMALKARKDYPEIRFNQSVMAGDSLSDMVFGRRAGMSTVFISSTIADIRKGARLIDAVYPDLITFARHLTT